MAFRRATQNRPEATAASAAAGREGQETALHATCVAIDGRGVVLTGASGAGKSGLGLQLIDGGAMLVSDDVTAICREGPAVDRAARPCGAPA